MKKKFWSNLDKYEMLDLFVHLMGIWGQEKVKQNRDWKNFLENQVRNSIEFDYSTQTLCLSNTVRNGFRKNRNKKSP